jgi:catechol 2,3-dioxygenase-like lactoylglutathione lyase family enzyme
MLVRGVNHISFAVRDLERSRGFYEGVLGLASIERPDFGIPGRWYQAGDSQVHLIQVPEGVDTGSPPPALSPLANHQAFAIGDYAQVLAQLQSHGLEVMETTPENGQLFVQDPDGNMIEFIVDGIRG